jgi:hypothetical protein
VSAAYEAAYQAYTTARKKLDGANNACAALLDLLASEFAPLPPAAEGRVLKALADRRDAIAAVNKAVAAAHAAYKIAGEELVKVVNETAKICPVCRETWLIVHACKGDPTPTLVLRPNDLLDGIMGEQGAKP